MWNVCQAPPVGAWMDLSVTNPDPKSVTTVACGASGVGAVGHHTAACGASGVGAAGHHTPSIVGVR